MVFHSFNELLCFGDAELKYANIPSPSGGSMQVWNIKRWGSFMVFLWGNSTEFCNFYNFHCTLFSVVHKINKFNKLQWNRNTFVNPHLFWFVLKYNERGEHLKNLNKQLLETCKQKNTFSDKFEVGEIVAGKINDNLYRPIIEDIETD